MTSLMGSPGTSGTSGLPSSAEITAFADTLVSLMGMQFTEARHDELGHALQGRLQARHDSCTTYLTWLRSTANHAELALLARELTITETYFLRHAEQFQALTDAVLPERDATGLPVRILSAGCASGEEAYSIAMLLRERFPHMTASITAIDLNPAMLQKAARGIYSNWALRACPDDTRMRWFRRVGDNFELDAGLRQMVHFEQRNLAEEAPGFWLAERFDIIFCRNVLMYFSPAQAQAAVARMAHALTPGGYLFLGHAETLRGLSGAFLLCHTHDAFYYRYRGPTWHDSETDAQQGETMPHAFVLPRDTGWVEAIRQASERVHALIPAESQHAHAEQKNEPGFDGDMLLLKAVNASHDGKLDEAEALCRTLLAADDMSAGAHYVLALCREGRGAADDAFEHDRIAAYLDPGFAMPRLHMGLSLRRAGQREAARAELEAAATLLQLEDPARVLLFGGGFQRDALIGLCHAELNALEARA